jgi:hypothetical protein
VFRPYGQHWLNGDAPYQLPHQIWTCCRYPPEADRVKLVDLQEIQTSRADGRGSVRARTPHHQKKDKNLNPAVKAVFACNTRGVKWTSSYPQIPLLLPRVYDCAGASHASLLPQEQEASMEKDGLLVGHGASADGRRSACYLRQTAEW